MGNNLWISSRAWFTCSCVRWCAWQNLRDHLSDFFDVHLNNKSYFKRAGAEKKLSLVGWHFLLILMNLSENHKTIRNQKDLKKPGNDLKVIFTFFLLVLLILWPWFSSTHHLQLSLPSCAPPRPELDLLHDVSKLISPLTIYNYR